MRFPRLLPPAALALAAGLAACADTAPMSVAAPVDGPSRGYKPAPMTVTTKGDTTVSQFTVSPQNTASFAVGAEHKITFPANTVCDPALSSYGPGEWGRNCTLLTTPIQITAKSWTDAAGHPRVDFQPALRFVAGVKSQAVTLYLKDKAAATQAMWQILYCPDGATTCVDESTTDKTLATRYDLSNGYVYRPLKHFSGYSVGVGRTSDGY